VISDKTYFLHIDFWQGPVKSRRAVMLFFVTSEHGYRQIAHKARTEVMNTESPFIFPLSITVKGSMKIEGDCQAQLSSLEKLSPMKKFQVPGSQLP
jgi:hypothetical protein